MYYRAMIMACLIPLFAGCGIRQAERDEVEAQKNLIKEQQQIDKVEKQIKDLKQATDY